MFPRQVKPHFEGFGLDPHSRNHGSISLQFRSYVHVRESSFSPNASAHAAIHPDTSQPISDLIFLEQGVKVTIQTPFLPFPQAVYRSV